MKQDNLKPEEILATRKNPILIDREEALEEIDLAIKGGMPYIDERLTKFPCETTTEFRARKRQAFLSNYIKRIIEQMNESLFSVEPKRDGIDEDFYEDVSMSGDSLDINSFFENVNSLYETQGWCWIRVDRLGALRDEDGNVIEQSVAQKEMRGDRIYLNLYSALEVVDWEYDDKGKLKWILTEEWRTEKALSPFEKQAHYKTRTLYIDGQVIVYKIEKNKQTKKDEAVEIERSSYDLDVPPFILVGIPIAQPSHWEDIERIQASLLNLESSYQYSLWKSHFSVLVLADSCIRAMMEMPDVNDSGEAVDLILSEGRALTEDQDSQGITRFISPSGADKQVIAEQIQFLKGEMFDTVGFNLRKSGRDAESAEAKAWDYKLIETFLQQRSKFLENIEKKVIGMATELDPDFSEYEPKWNTDFGIRDLKSEMETLILGLNLQLPQNAKNELIKQAFEIVTNLPSTKISAEVKEQMMIEIANQMENTIQMFDASNQ